MSEPYTDRYKCVVGPDWPPVTSHCAASILNLPGQCRLGPGACPPPPPPEECVHGALPRSLRSVTSLASPEDTLWPSYLKLSRWRHRLQSLSPFSTSLFCTALISSGRLDVLLTNSLARYQKAPGWKGFCLCCSLPYLCTWNRAQHTVGPLLSAFSFPRASPDSIFSPQQCSFSS